MTVFQEIANRTNIHFNITAVNDSVKSEQFNLMISSGDYCDIITSVNTLYSTGSEGAYNDDVVIDLYDLVQEYAPHYWAMLSRDDDSVRTMVTGDDNLMTSLALQFQEPGYGGGGLLIRQDILDALSLDRPKTYDELHDTLLAIYEESGAQMMISTDGISEDLIGGYNVVAGEYVVDGQVHYGYMEDDMYDYLSMMADWYKEGLIQKDFYSADMFGGINGMSNGSISVTNGRPNSIPEIENGSTVDGIQVTATYYPTKTGTETIHVGGTQTTSYIRTSSVWSISTTCEDPVPLIKLCDYFNTDDGILLFNYGVEGEAFTYDESGKPQWTELISNNDAGMTYAQAAYIYASSAGSEYLPSVFDETKAYYNYSEAQLEAVDIFKDKSDGAYDYPEGATLTADELSAISSMSSTIETYIEEQVLTWITGAEDLDESAWSDFTATLKEMGVEEIIEAYQIAYDRYMS
jgi:putative aldouronate transport system substrate-binding protein